MKVIIDIDDKRGCADCPYCHYRDDFEDGCGHHDNSRDGFYCHHDEERKIAEWYDSKDGNGLVIPDWCRLSPLKPIEKERLDELAQESLNMTLILASAAHVSDMMRADFIGGFKLGAAKILELLKI